MSIVSLLGIKVLNNPAKFTDPYEFEITFECLEPLKHDLEWKLTYVGSSRSLDHDQELDSILVGPIPVGINRFKFVADAPSPALIPASELVSVTVILLSCSYNGKEFVRVGYYVNNEYDLEELRENPPQKVPIKHVVRNILAEKPRVTRFNIVWDNEGEEDFYPPVQEEPEEEPEDEDEDEDEDENEDEDDGEDVEDDESIGDEEEAVEDNEEPAEEDEVTSGILDDENVESVETAENEPLRKKIKTERETNKEHEAESVGPGIDEELPVQKTDPENGTDIDGASDMPTPQDTTQHK